MAYQPSRFIKWQAIHVEPKRYYLHYRLENNGIHIYLTKLNVRTWLEFRLINFETAY